MASWAELYEARKAERLKKEEKMKLNKILGFSNSASYSQAGVDVKVTEKLENENYGGGAQFTDQVGNIGE